MNVKNIFTLLLVIGIIMISCNNKKKTNNGNHQKTIEQKSTINKELLIGSWNDQSSSALHFSLLLDGTAKSDNMETLLYQKWKVKGNQLYLTVKSIGNGNSSIDTEIYEIQKLDKNQMILKQGEFRFEYKKFDYNYETYIGDNGKVLKTQFLTSDDKAYVDFKGNKITLTQEITASGALYKNNQYELILWHGETILKQDDIVLFKQTPKTLTGKLVLGHEAQGFKPCTSDKEFWITDRTGKLTKRYNELTKGNKPYTPIFVEIKIINKGVAKDGFAADYDGVFDVITVLQTRRLTDKDCK